LSGWPSVTLSDENNHLFAICQLPPAAAAVPFHG
jgi:hypothetical protein